MEEIINSPKIEIHKNAPGVAYCKTLVHAEIDEVWELLSDINRWPMWVSSVSDAWLKGDLEPGSPFTWKKNSMKINSTILSLEPERSLCWSGSALGIRAIHTWELKSKENGKTLVTTAESMEGILARLFFSTTKLEEVLNDWLSDLKAASEL